VANGLNSATFSGTITGVDYTTGQEKTVTVNADMTATGKPYTSTFSYREVTPNFKYVQNQNGMVRPASGSLNISGDLTFSTDDASGNIEKVRYGIIQVQKL
jgi:hypothetical protein